MDHETYSLVPEFPNLDSFLIEYEKDNLQPTFGLGLDDTTFFMNLYQKARVLTKRGKTEEAIQRLEQLVAMFGEYSDSWTLLAANYYAINEIDKAEQASLNAIISNYVFGFPSKKSIEQFYRIDTNGKWKDNPLVKRKEGLLQGGDYQKPFSVNYDKWLDAIAEFRQLKDLRSSTLLEQNYGELMHSEPPEMKEKYGFKVDEWLANFAQQLWRDYPDRKF